MRKLPALARGLGFGLGAIIIALGALPPEGPAAAATGGTASVPVSDNAYWLAAANGAVYNFGGAPSYGSMFGQRLNKPIVGMAATPTGKGYWLVASDGGIFAFGTARFDGSMGGTRLSRPITGMAATPTGKGYWLVASDGGIFAFGAAGFDGSLGKDAPASAAVAMAATFTGAGYWIATAGGTVSQFGQAVNWGPATSLTAPVVAMSTAVGTGQETTPPVFSAPTASYAPGSYGYDVSSYTCGNLPPSPHTIGIVQVAGGSFGALNRCFAKEVAWAGSGLGLYLYLTHGTAVSAEPGCAGNPTAPTVAACNYGYAAGLDAYEKARDAIGTKANVTWWLDIEEGGWTGTRSSNRSTVVGAYDALRSAGPSSVGFYFSVSNWNDIVGNYDPVGAPLFPAWWSGPSPQYKCVNARAVAASNNDVIPSGPVTLVQYNSTGTRDYDYAC